MRMRLSTHSLICLLNGRANRLACIVWPFTMCSSSSAWTSSLVELRSTYVSLYSFSSSFTSSHSWCIFASAFSRLYSLLACTQTSSMASRCVSSPICSISLRHDDAECGSE